MQELIIDYSECQTLAPLRTATNPEEFHDIPSDKVSSSFKSGHCTLARGAQWQRHEVDHIKYGTDTKKTPTTICTLNFAIPQDLEPPVLFYYRLTNFYQNHRRYVKSLDTHQLRGDALSVPDIQKGFCDPLKVDDKANKPYYPCGLIANSLFNDTFREVFLISTTNSSEPNKTYEMTNKGISWDSDKALYGNTKYKPEDIAVPPNWKERWPNGYTAEHPPPNLNEDEEFQVWMRTAGLPAFSKLAKRNDHDTMKCGTYQVEVELSTSIKGLN